MTTALVRLEDTPQRVGGECMFDASARLSLGLPPATEPQPESYRIMGAHGVSVLDGDTREVLHFHRFIGWGDA